MREHIKATAHWYEAEIAKTTAELAEYEGRGVAALSVWDQTLGCAMPGGAAVVLAMSKELLGNHLRWCESKFSKLVGQARQMTLFDAPKPVDLAPDAHLDAEDDDRVSGLEAWE